MELLYRLCAVLVDASTQQKGSVSLVAVQEVPVELIARSAEFLAFRVEQVVAAYAFESRDAVQVFGRSDGESFDQLQSLLAERTAILGRFVAVQLYVVQAETVGIDADVFLAFIDKDTDSPGMLRKIFRNAVQIAGRFGVEDEAYHVYSQLFYLADVFRIGHSADFDDHSCLKIN